MNNLQFGNSLRGSPQASRENPNHIAQPCVDHTAPCLYSHLQDCAAAVSLPCRTVTLENHFRSGPWWHGRSTVVARSEHSPVSMNTTRSNSVFQTEMTSSRFYATQHDRRTIGAQPCKCELAFKVLFKNTNHVTEQLNKFQFGTRLELALHSACKAELHSSVW
jgi:hypothetical protein